MPNITNLQTQYSFPGKHYKLPHYNTGVMKIMFLLYALFSIFHYEDSTYNVSSNTSFIEEVVRISLYIVVKYFSQTTSLTTAQVLNVLDIDIKMLRLGFHTFSRKICYLTIR